ncbi:MAG: T9SS type A sorting domain-containing protein [Bacteroidales bacterium]|nr:T9SS type A sorting domain-containing protein [Bacteroidales bacterium]
MKLISLTFLLLISCFAFSQNDVIFNYNYPYQWNYDCNLMLINDSDYYIAGDVGRVTAECEYVLYGFHITKINNNGIRDTTVIFDKCEQTSYMAWNGSMYFNSGNIVMIGHEYNTPVYNRLFFMKINTSFDTVSNICIMDDTLTKRAFSFAFDYENNIVIAGGTDSTYNEMTGLPETTYSKSSLFKVKQNGDMIWQHSYSFGDISDGCWSIFHRVINTPDSGFIAIGRTSDFGNSKNLILKTDRLGNQQWVRFYGTSSYDNPTFTDIIPTHDSCFIVCGAYTYGEIGGGYYPYDAWILKIDNNGNTKWDRKHRDSIVYDVIANDYYGYYRGVVEKDNGDLLAICNTYSDEDSVFIGQGFRIRCLDSFGNKKWDKVITRVGNQGGPLWPQSIQLTDDNGIAIGGWADIYYYDELNLWVSDQRIFLIKTDSLGNDTLISDISPIESKPITEFKLQCYPNPASSEFFVDLPQSVDDDVLEIYSTNGSLVHEQAVGYANNKIDICGLQPGMCLVKIRGAGLYGKIIID